MLSELLEKTIYKVLSVHNVGPWATQRKMEIHEHVQMVSPVQTLVSLVNNLLATASVLTLNVPIVTVMPKM